MALSRMDSTSCSVSWTKTDKQEVGYSRSSLTAGRLPGTPGVRQTHPFDSFLQFVINEQREVLRRPRVEVQEILEVAGDGLFEEPVVVERLLEETVEARLQVQQTLQRDEAGTSTRR